MESAESDAGVTVRAARDRYFADSGAMVVEYDRFWARGRFEGVEFHFPNPPAHGRALRCHDLHHVLTRYGTDWVGEAELSAWELAGGCGRYVAAFGFDLAGTALGLCVAPRRTFRAFVRGRRTKNLFRVGYRPELLDMTVGELRRMLGLDDREPEATAGDYLRFALYGALGLPWIALAPLSAIALGLSCLAPAPREPPAGAAS